MRRAALACCLALLLAGCGAPDRDDGAGDARPVVRGFSVAGFTLTLTLAQSFA